MEKLRDVKSLDKVFEVQTEYAKTAYQDYIAQVTKFGELYANLAKEAFKPFESYLAKASINNGEPSKAWDHQESRHHEARPQSRACV